MKPVPDPRLQCDFTRKRLCFTISNFLICTEMNQLRVTALIVIGFPSF